MSPIIAAVLSGCGGNGQATGFNGNINTSNAVAVAATGYFSSARVIPFGDLGSRTVTGAEIQQPSRAFNLVDFAKAQIEALAERNGQYPAASLTGVVTDLVYNCVTGSGTIRWNDNDGDNAFSSGDSFVFDFSNCAVRDILGTLVYNNQMTMTQFNLVGDPINNPAGGWQMGALFTLNDLSVQEGLVTRTYNGGFDFSSVSLNGASETLTITGQSLTGVADNASDVLKDFSVTEKLDRATFAYTLQADSTLDSARYGVLTIKTQTPFSGFSPFTPGGGVMLVTAADKSSVKMTVDSLVNISLDVDANGDGTVDQTLSTAWSVLETS